MAADLSAVTAGRCITAAAVPAAGAAVERVGVDSGADSRGRPVRPSPSSAGDQTPPFTATVVQLRDPVNGCLHRWLRRRVRRRAPPSGAAPSGAVPDRCRAIRRRVPSGGVRPSGATRSRWRGRLRAACLRHGGLGRPADVITVTVTDPSTSADLAAVRDRHAATTYTKTAAAASDALVVGKCAVVQGSADSKGAVTATSIAVSTPAAGATCTPDSAVAAAAHRAGPGPGQRRPSPRVVEMTDGRKPDPEPNVDPSVGDPPVESAGPATAVAAPAWPNADTGHKAVGGRAARRTARRRRRRLTAAAAFVIALSVAGAGIAVAKTGNSSPTYRTAVATPVPSNRCRRRWERSAR